jgi:formate--tetrahydrofolate ligase
MTNLDIAQQVRLRPIDDIACSAGLSEEDFEPLGRTKGKLTDAGIQRLTSGTKTGKLILVSAVNPTPAGEGKTTVSVGLAQGLCQLGKRAIPALREPALGPVFGVKGGATGGGYSQVLPMEDINLFFTGDFPAITSAHNLLSAMLDASLHAGNPVGMDLRSIWWPRTVDMNDRALREIVVGLGTGNGPARGERFVITPASEVMAVLCLARSRASLKERLQRIIVALDSQGAPITAGALGAAGSMGALLKDAIRPNLAQTVEGGPALIHGGPFGNVAHGCSSVLATRCGIHMTDYLVTEGGFGSDLGGEKFLNIVTPQLGKTPDAIVLVATVRALRHHGAGDLVAGCANLGQHIRHLRSYGPPVVVAINKFADDTVEDLKVIEDYALAQGVEAVVADPWMSGGKGCVDLAAKVVSVTSETSNFNGVYHADDDIETKLQKLVTRVYGGKGVTYSRAAEKRLKWATDHGYGKLPVCVAKTQMSLSDDARLVGAPSGFDLHVRELQVSAGAGFVVAVCGDIMLMPGMGKTPAAMRIDITDEGVITGLN